MGDYWGCEHHSGDAVNWFWCDSGDAVDVNEDTGDGQTASGMTVFIFGAEINLHTLILAVLLLVTIVNVWIVCTVMRQRRNQRAHGYAVAKMAESDIEMSPLEEDAFIKD